MHIIFFPLLWVHFVAAIGDSKAGLAGYKPYIKPGIIGYTCQTNNQGTVEVNLQEIKAAHNSACNLSKQKGRFTNFPTKFIPFQGQSLDFFSEKYYINPASFVKYPDLFIIMTRECMLAGMVTATKDINGLPKLHYAKAIENRSINSSVSRRNRIFLRKRLVQGTGLQSCQKILGRTFLGPKDGLRKNHMPSRNNFASFAS